MIELCQRIQGLVEEVSGADWEPERVREIADAALQALAEIADMPTKDGNANAAIEIFDLHADIYRDLERVAGAQLEVRLRREVTKVMANAMLYPEALQPRVLGQDMGPMIDHVMEAVLNTISVDLVKNAKDPEPPVSLDARRTIAERAAKPRWDGTKFRFVTLDNVPGPEITETEAYLTLSKGHPLGYIEQWNPIRRVWEPLGSQRPPEFEYRAALGDGKWSTVVYGAEALALLRLNVNALAQTRVKGSDDAWVEMER